MNTYILTIVFTLLGQHQMITSREFSESSSTDCTIRTESCIKEMNKSILRSCTRYRDRYVKELKANKVVSSYEIKENCSIK